MKPKTIALAVSAVPVIIGVVMIVNNRKLPGFWKGFGSAFLIFALSNAVVAAGAVISAAKPNG